MIKRSSPFEQEPNVHVRQSFVPECPSANYTIALHAWVVAARCRVMPECPVLASPFSPVFGEKGSNVA
eukprot:5522042-Amphidinium_carterae.1